MRAFAFLSGSELDSSSWNDCMGILESAGYRRVAIDWRKALEISGRFLDRVPGSS